MLTAAADRPHASNTSWSDAIQALLHSSEPAQLEQRLGQVGCGPPASMPPEDMAALHAAEAANPNSTNAAPAMTCKQEQPVVTLAGGAESLVPASVDAATAAVDTATAAVASATASAHDAALGSGQGYPDQQASACHLLLPAAAAAAAGCSQVRSPPCNSERAGKAGHGVAEQLADSSGAAQACKAQIHQITEASAAQLPVAQPPAAQTLVSQLPAVQPRQSVSPSQHQSSEASTRRRITASSGRTATTGLPDVLRRGQPTQLAFSSVRPPPPVPTQGVSLPVTGRLLPQLPPAAASSVHINQLPASSHEATQMLQTQLLHVAQPSCKVTTAPDATQPGSTALLASHTHGEHGSTLPTPQSTTSTPHPPACQPVGPLQTLLSCMQHSATRCSVSTQPQQPDIMQVQRHPQMQQQHAPTCLTLEQQQQQPLPPWPQLPGPVSQKLHTLLQQLETTPWPSGMQAPQMWYPPSPPRDVLTFPSVLVQDPGLPATVESVPQGCCSGGADLAQRQGGAVADTVASMLPVDASRSASVPAGGSLQADLPADTHDASAPWGLLPGPLRAAIASAMTTEGVRSAAAVQGMSHQPMAHTPAWRRWVAAWEAGLFAPGVSKGKGTKRRRADSDRHDALSNRTGMTGSPSATPFVAEDTVLRQHTGSATHIWSGGKTAKGSTSFKAHGTSVVGIEAVVSSGTAPCIPNIIEGPKCIDDKAAGSAGKAGAVHAQARRDERLTSVQVGDVNKGRPVETLQAMCILTSPTKGKLTSDSKLSCSDPCKLVIAVQQSSNGDTVPVEHNSGAAEYIAHNYTGADAGVNALHQTPERDGTGGVTTSLAQTHSHTADLCTGERLAKDALLMLCDEGTPISTSCEKGLTKQTSGHAVSQPPREDVSCVDRPPPFVDVEGASAYEVDKVIDRRYYKAGSQVRVQYLVRWKDYSADDDTWQSRNSLRHARQAIQDFEESQ